MKKKQSIFYIIVSFVLFFQSFGVYPVGAQENKEKTEIVVATWNIGYFSNGVSSRSFIKPADYERKLKEYRSLIYDSIHPDIISINEYNRVFIGKENEDNKHVTSSVLFDIFDKQVVGPSKGIRKALFSKVELKKSRFTYFERHKKIVGDDSIKVQEGYYIATDITLGGKKVKLVCVHLLFSRKVPRVVQQYQIEELVEKYKKYDKVIMCGDWNTGNYSLLKNAGYTLANNGKFVTFPQRKTPLDNIAVKGLKMSDVRVIKTDLSDHYPIMCKISVE